MTLCPIALLATCNKCPAVSVCPLKGVIGDYKVEDSTQAPAQDTAQPDQADKPPT